MSGYLQDCLTTRLQFDLQICHLETGIEKKRAENWKAFAVLIGWQSLALFIAQHVGWMWKKCLWSKNKQIIVSLKAMRIVIHRQSPENYMWGEREHWKIQPEPSTYKSTWTWTTRCGKQLPKKTRKLNDVLLGEHFYFVLCKLSFVLNFFRWRLDFSCRKTKAFMPETFCQPIAWSISDLWLRFCSQFDRWLTEPKWFIRKFLWRGKFRQKTFMSLCYRTNATDKLCTNATVINANGF